MGMHSPGWREQNEETAREEWREEVREHLASIRSAEALYKLRNGPENPENQS
jgi:hypothetical protein